MTTPINLRRERLRRGLSAKALADQIGTSEDVVLRAERDGRRPSPSNAAKIAGYFEVDVFDQWPDEDSAPTAEPAESAA